MKTIDRYIIRQFLTNYVILFAVLELLVMSVDFVVNLDEFLRAGQDDEGALSRVWSIVTATLGYYWPKVFRDFVYLSGILPAAAAGFTLSAMVRNREMVALLAGGVSLYRLALPILMVGFIVSGSVLVIQELVIPPLRERVAAQHKYIKYGGIKPLTIEFIPDKQPDGNPGPLYSAARFDVNTKRLEELTVLKRDGRGRASEKITAEAAEWDETNRGWRLTGGLSYPRVASTDSAQQRRARPVPVAFVPSGLDPDTLLAHRKSQFREMMRSSELIDLIQRKTILDPKELTLILHKRFSIAVVNVLILTMALPFFMLRAPGGLMVPSLQAMSVCLPVWFGAFAMTQQIGNIPPALLAWVPAVIYLPVALFLLDRVKT